MRRSVALFTRAWIEIKSAIYVAIIHYVALFTRAWIEINFSNYKPSGKPVALFTRAWIEIDFSGFLQCSAVGRPLHEGVD